MQHYTRRRYYERHHHLSPFHILCHVSSLPVLLFLATCLCGQNNSRRSVISHAFMVPSARIDGYFRRIPSRSMYPDREIIFCKSPLFLKFRTQQNTCHHQQNPLHATDITDASRQSLALEETETPDQTLDIPIPTANGGYSHTAASKAKISAANKGKTPWNKGKTRSDEVKQKIAEGVRRKNRERFLAKLKEMGLTEEEYEQQKKEERRKKDAERRARMTENGGYRPTEETRQKISKILKDKHARGEIKKKTYNGPFRKGFTHSEETKEKIRNSLKKKWAEDPVYQAKMKKTGQKANTVSARQKISQTLKQKWQDPEFRMRMINSMKGRKSPSMESSKAQREKISAAMKKKWQDRSYREKAILGMERYRDSLPPRPTKTKTVRKINNGSTERKIVAVTPMTESTQVKKSIHSKVKVASAGGRTKTIKKKKAIKQKKIAKTSASVESETINVLNDPATATVKDTPHDSDNNGDISRMKEERRDLYDLLYGDDYDDITHDDANTEFRQGNGDFTIGNLDLDYLEEDENHVSAIGPETTGVSPFFTTNIHLDDEDLDDFDPYNLDDY